MVDKKPSHSAKHAFFYLTSFFALGLVSVNLGVIFFQVINHYFPLGINDYSLNFSQDVLKFAIAALIVASPVYYALTRHINRSISKKDLDEDSGIRKWLTYIVMFFAVVIVISDLIAAILSFLNGEFTIRFFLKVLTIFVISGAVFLYYLTDMKNKDQKARNQKNNWWAGGYWVFLLVPLFFSFTLIESPETTRLRRMDDQSVGELEQVRGTIDSFYIQEGTLPSSIGEITTPQYYLPDMVQLEKEGFTYKKTGDMTYTLCIDFNLASDQANANQYSPSEFWKHKAGQACFDLKPQTYGVKIMDPAVNELNP